MTDLRKGELESFESLQWGKGQPASFAKFFFHYYPEYYDFSFSLLDNASSARNLVTEAFFLLWKKRPDVDTLVNCKAFLYNTVRQHCTQFLGYLQTTTSGATVYVSDKKSWPVLPVEVLIEVLAFAETYEPRG